MNYGAGDDPLLKLWRLNMYARYMYTQFVTDIHVQDAIRRGEWQWAVKVNPGQVIRELDVDRGRSNA